MNLDDLEGNVRDLEEVNRYDVQWLRTVEHIIDPTPWPRYPRIVLHVAMLYARKWEQLALYGNKTALERYRPKAHLSYAMRYEGVLLPLSRSQAVELLEMGRVPNIEVPPGVEETEEIDIDALFEELGKRSIHADLGASKRATRLRKEAGQY